ncbi:trans-aconitate 2-methyltransferase [Streptomyces mobaraensis NBRC 13819 = DSM 40847]|uniref:Trans-aconitate 2-methyltransferase n=1 Tax=Streptomyces mobaraensis (strain ATCC 29032 / DSM 40847 / JCM 4168 / NBRC 13819 / NCIMB 11159 / IPCR 16-22) TaxID=1223523 RepID=M3BBY3_STRM1|nr:trans-aconitate 2-methyltransferase [Streptomyces mobaraensis]EME97074.1 trans-aconitate 2-methyltransferase [Streptomyces mobaraensis NBRC 13819 = DSM 40847]QTT74179.1 trans-aconitate 2-methyltransferase [Streptomyces mobaraensis NBRC 13819 = DSM 40847]
MPHTPAWDPRQYLRHSGPRTRPFHDLLARVPDLPGPGPARITDLGCGAGNATALLADRWPDALITGLDNSPEMLRAAAAHAGPTGGGGRISFAAADAAHWTPDGPLDLIIANALLQWVPDHPASFPAWAGALTPGGVLAFQVPGNQNAPSHTLMRRLCDTVRWRTRLAGAARGPVHVLDPAAYLTLLTDLGLTVDAWETTYVHVLPGPDPVLDWLKGTGLRPVLTALADEPEEREQFLTEYAALLREAYPPGPHGTVFPFRRIFVVARKPGGERRSSDHPFA